MGTLQIDQHKIHSVLHIKKIYNFDNMLKYEY